MASVAPPRVAVPSPRARARARSRRASAAASASASSHPPGGVAEWIETNLPDAGAVTRSISLGGSGWAEFSSHECESGAKYFAKTSRRDAEMFMGEGAGLSALHATATLVIPRVYHAGSLPEGSREGRSFIVMDHLGAFCTPVPVRPRPRGERRSLRTFSPGVSLRPGSLAFNPDAPRRLSTPLLTPFNSTPTFARTERPSDFGARGDQAEFGASLARMHLAEPAVAEARDDGMFGFSVNNTIGDTPQPNAWGSDWVEFFREKRIRHQLKLARDSTLSELGEAVVENMPRWFAPCGEIRPSILHGDLWSGNIGTVGGRPSAFDPAVYYGHSEAEFGMSWCAGFTQAS